MSTDPSLIDPATPPKTYRRPMPEDIEERKAVIWVPIGIALLLMLGIGYYFYGPHLG